MYKDKDNGPGSCYSAAYMSKAHNEVQLALVLACHHTNSIVFLKLTVSSRPSVPTRGSHKCLRFGSWPKLPTIKDFTYLFTYLVIYLLVMTLFTLRRVRNCRRYYYYYYNLKTSR